jgi:AAHS family 4-hydroxybenzoate transporter-like MFS transporter
MLTVTGALINGVQTTMFALAAHVYPARIRATGVVAPSRSGRIGAGRQRVRGGLGARLPRRHCRSLE